VRELQDADAEIKDATDLITAGGLSPKTSFLSDAAAF
jgi:hypothetical protein